MLGYKGEPLHNYNSVGVLGRTSYNSKKVMCLKIIPYNKDQLVLGPAYLFDLNRFTSLSIKSIRIH